MMGDIAYADDSFGYHPFEFRYEHVYNGYMNWMQNISAKIPFMTVPGNHESECHSPVCYIFHNLSDNLANFTAYNTRFSMPSQESNGVESMWYSFNYGGIHFTMINTETDFPGAAEENHGDSGKTWPAGHFASNGTYMKWLEQDLSKANQERDKKPWIIAVGHRPAVFILDTFSKLFRKYNVDMYISGHLHEYVRFLPTNNSIKSKNHYHNINETTEIIVGSAGCDEMKYVTDTNGKISIVRKEHEKYSFTNNVKLPEKVSKAMGIGLLHYINKTMLHWQLMESYSGKVIDELFITK